MILSNTTFFYFHSCPRGKLSWYQLCYMFIGMICMGPYHCEFSMHYRSNDIALSFSNYGSTCFNRLTILEWNICISVVYKSPIFLSISNMFKQLYMWHLHKRRESVWKNSMYVCQYGWFIYLFCIGVFVIYAGICFPWHILHICSLYYMVVVVILDGVVMSITIFPHLFIFPIVMSANIVTCNYIL